MNDKFTVIFDFDGTLANSIELILKIYNEHHEEYSSLPLTREQMSRYQKLGYKKAMKKVGIRWTVLPRLALMIRREMKLHMDEVQPYEGIVAMLHELKESGVSLGILTSNNRITVQEYLEANDFPEFDFVVSEKTLFGKEKALRKIIRRHKLDKNRVIYVGDEPRDVISCKKANIPVIGVAWGLGGVDGLTPSNPDKIVRTSTELYSEIQKFMSN